MRIVALILAFAAAAAMRAQTSGGPTVTVHVVNSSTGAPIAGATVVMGDEGDQVWGRTDGAGSFSGTAKSAGKYLLTVSRNGYRMIGGVMGKIVEIRAGSGNETIVQMLPFGVIAGRVVDQYGDPVSNAIVRTIDKMEIPGHGEDYADLDSAFTDDRGEYRIAGVEPGKHYVAAEFGTQNMRQQNMAARNRWPEEGGFVLFPDSTDIDGAQTVEVHAAQTMRLADLHLKMQPAVTITGSVKPAQKGVSTILHRTGVQLGLSVFAFQGGYSDTAGNFTMSVLPGTYVLSASDRQTGKFSEDVTIEVRDKNVDNVRLTLTSSYEITGRVHIDGAGTPDYSKVALSFDQPVKIAGDGSFHASLSPGKVHYMIHELPENWYVKDVLVGGQRLTSSEFEVHPGTTDVSISLSPRGGQVTVKLESVGSSVLDSAYVLLLPEKGPLPDVESSLHAEPSESGPLVVHGVPPGSYRVFALDMANWTLIMGPNILMDKYGKQAPLVSIVEGERKTIVVSMTKVEPE
jgi:hypothetical protein